MSKTPATPRAPQDASGDRTEPSSPLVRLILALRNLGKPPTPTEPAGGPEGAPPVRPRQWRLSWPVIAMIMFGNYLLISHLTPSAPERIDIPYTVFKQQVEAANVVEVMSRADIIQGTFKQPITHPPDGGNRARTAGQFATVLPAFADPGLETLLIEQGVVINARPLEEPRSWWLNLLLSFGPTVLLIGAFVWVSRRAARQMGGGVFGLGRSGARRYVEEEQGERRVSFEDVAGIDEAEQELVEIVDFLKDPQKYTRLGGTVPKGVLLVGLPGTGKTLLARAVAGEAGVPFFSMGASEFVEMIVGVGASRVRDLFKQAREAAPAIIFIDELDAIGRTRGGSMFSGGHSEQEQTLNQILTEMDGFSSREGVIVLAATNRPDVLDAALLRPGRFDRRVVVQPPDKVGREAILKVHTGAVPLAPDVDLRQVAGSTPGLVGADLKNLVNEAALLAARRDEDAVHQLDFMDALEKLILGPARELVMSDEERERVAFHEGGHTILGLVVAGADPVNRVTIMPRGQALGVTYQRPEDDRHNYHEAYLLGRVIGALGGRAAEQVVYGTRTTGSENDMEQATNLARQMVTRWGMSAAFGPVTLAPRDGSFPAVSEAFGVGGARVFSEATAQLIDAEVRRVLDESYAEAVRLLAQHRSELDALAAALLEHETLDEQEIRRVTGLPSAPRLQNSALPTSKSELAPHSAGNGRRRNGGTRRPRSPQSRKTETNGEGNPHSEKVRRPRR